MTTLVPGTDDRITFGAVLDRLEYEIDGGEFLSIGYRPVGCGFSTVVRSPADAIRFVFECLLGPYSEFDCDVYFSVNAVADGVGCGRGKESDIARWNALYSDFDVKPGAFTNIERHPGLHRHASARCWAPGRRC